MDTLTPDPQFLEPTFKRATILWWALLWRGVLLAGGAGLVVGFVEGFVGSMAGVSSDTIRNLNYISGLIVGIPVGIYVVQVVLRKQFSEFTIRLVRTGAGSAN